MEKRETTGFVEVKAVGGRSTVTRAFSTYPLKFLVPSKVNFLRISASDVVVAVDIVLMI